MFKSKVVLMVMIGLVVLSIITGCAAVATPSAAALDQSNSSSSLGGGTTVPSNPGSSLAAAPAGSRGITVVGMGHAFGTPDTATATIGVDLTGATPDQATKSNNDQLAAVIKALKDAGIDEKDIQTAYYSVYTEQRFKPETGQSTGEYVYHASSSVNVTIRDLGKVGTVLDKAVAAGANNISGVNFNVADTTQLEATAREKAVADARARATDLARLFNVQLGDVIAISEVTTGGPMPMYDRGASAGLGGGGAPIQPGQLSVSMQLQVTFELK